MADYNKAIELDANHPNAYNGRADLWLKLNQYNIALKDINMAISLNEKDYVFHITKGEIYMAMEDYSAAIKEFTFALSLEDTPKEAYNFRGKCYHELAKLTSKQEEKQKYETLAEVDEKRYEELKNHSND